jgi:hypothetical protein
MDNALQNRIRTPWLIVPLLAIIVAFGAWSRLHVTYAAKSGHRFANKIQSGEFR